MGKVENEFGNVVETSINWYDSDDPENHLIGQAKSDPETGNYVIVLPAGKNYKCEFVNPNYKIQTKSIDLKSQRSFNKETGKNIILIRE